MSLLLMMTRAPEAVSAWHMLLDALEAALADDGEAPRVFCYFDAVAVVDGVRLGETLADRMDRLVDNGIRFWVCPAAAARRGLGSDDGVVLRKGFAWRGLAQLVAAVDRGSAFACYPTIHLRHRGSSRRWRLVFDAAPSSPRDLEGLEIGLAALSFDHELELVFTARGLPLLDDASALYKPLKSLRLFGIDGLRTDAPEAHWPTAPPLPLTHGREALGESVRATLQLTLAPECFGSGAAPDA